MPASNAAPTKRQTLNIRITPDDRALIDRAARARGKTRTDFILDAARQAAEDVLLRQTLIVTSTEAYAEFLSRLDQRPHPNARLRETMQTPPPWHKA